MNTLTLRKLPMLRRFSGMITVALAALLVAACGGGGGGGGSGAGAGSGSGQSVSSESGVVTTIAGQPLANGSADGTGTAATFYLPIGVATDGTNLYVADTDNDTIRQIVIATGAVTTIAGKVGIIGHADGTGTAATFSYPEGIATDGTDLYVADSGNNTIRQIVIATGAVTTLAGQPLVTGSADGTGSAATFNGPHGLSVDGLNLYVADTNNSTIRRIVIASGQVTTIAGQPLVTGSADGTGTAATFSYPEGILSIGNTTLFVADTVNSTIRKIVMAVGGAHVTTFAGTAGTFGTTDGAGTTATFNNPSAIASDGTNLYVTDAGNETIRKIILTTDVVSTIAGQVGVFGSADGTGSAATFNNPSGIATDGTNLYVADSSNDIIRQIH